MRRSLNPAVSLALSAIAVGVAGCNLQEHYGSCPTDARAITLSCAGQEAIRKCPCGPDAAYYGHRPTKWNDWPGGWGQYECEQCVVTTESATPTSATTSISGEPTLAVTVPVAEISSTSDQAEESTAPSDEETVPIEPIDSVDSVKESIAAEEVAPIAPRGRYETPSEPARPTIPAPKLPELPSVPPIPEAPRLNVDPALNDAAGLPDLPDPINPGPSEALPWGTTPAAATVPTESAGTTKRLPTYADLFKP